MEQNRELYRDDRPFEERVRELLSKMTLEEKFSQMTFRSPAIDRLGIPAYNWWNEALHGVARSGVATMFAQAIGLAATFDDGLVRRVADVISTEARAKYHEYEKHGDRGIYKGLTFWSPNVNIFRDPRWGRGHETYGEDPYLTGRMGVAFVKGIQGEDPKYLKAAACAKHYAVHSGPEELRHVFDAEVSAKDLWETYLPAFEDCVVEGNVEAVMGAYNRTNGQPCCGSPVLIQDILRDTWGFQGHFVSDCWAIMDFHQHHHVTATAPESAALALNAGCDVNCGTVYLHLQVAYQEGRIDEATLDRALTRLFMTRMKLGMFDAPSQVPYTAIPYEKNDCAEHRSLNLEAAEKSMVLLKNDGALPLAAASIKTIAVIGPNADSREALKGNYYGDASQYTTILEGIQQYVDQESCRVLYAKGCHLWKDREFGESEFDGDGITEAVIAAEKADAIVLCLGLDASLEGEEMHESNAYGSGDKPDLELPGLQQRLMESVWRAAKGKPIVLVLLNGSALAVNWAQDHIPAIVEAWYPGARGGDAVARLLFGEFSPAGRLPVTFYRTAEELPDFAEYSMEGRTYRYMAQDALYPFGYGLTYTTFRYDAVPDQQLVYRKDEPVTVCVDVTNTGTRDSDECVQLYLSHTIQKAKLSPKWSLKGFKRVHMAAGETRRLIFTLTAHELRSVEEDGSRTVESGAYTLYLSGGQPDARTRDLTGIEPVRYEIVLL